MGRGPTPSNMGMDETVEDQSALMTAGAVMRHLMSTHCCKNGIHIRTGRTCVSLPPNSALPPPRPTCTRPGFANGDSHAQRRAVPDRLSPRVSWPQPGTAPNRPRPLLRRADNSGPSRSRGCSTPHVLRRFVRRVPVYKFAAHGNVEDETAQAAEGIRRVGHSVIAVRRCSALIPPVVPNRSAVPARFGAVATGGCQHDPRRVLESRLRSRGSPGFGCR